MVHVFNFIRSDEIEYVNHKIARTIIHKHTGKVSVDDFWIKDPI